MKIKVDFKLLKGKAQNESFFAVKELSFCHKLKFSNSYKLAIKYYRPLIFQTVNYVR